MAKAAFARKASIAKHSKTSAGAALGPIRDKLRRFAAQRDWNKFHSPKNLSMALVIEAAELAEHFQWLTQAESRRISKRVRMQVEEELADVMLYLVRIADKLNVDLFEAARRKIELNAAKYPADRVRGSAKKYSDY